MNAKLYTDGGSRNNPGPAAIGGIIYDATGHELQRFQEYIGQATNNQAEYLALQRGLTLALSHQVRDLDVYLDSELVVRQLQGQYKIKEPALRQRAEEVRELMNSFASIHLHHIPREQNQLADALVNQALDEAVSS